MVTSTSACLTSRVVGRDEDGCGACAGVLLEVHAFSASFRLREPLPQTLKAVRTLLRGTHRCLRPFERAGPVTRHACRLRGTRGSIAQARAAHNARNRILRFTVSIWYAAQRDRTQRRTRPGRAWTAVDSRSCAAHYL
jgi:hypothetical protein